MAAVENTMKSVLEAGGLAASFNVVHWRSVNAAGLAKLCGFEWLFIDLEHNAMDLDTAAQMCVAALPTGVTPIVRVPSHDAFQTTRILDGGAMGVVVPHVDTPEQARRIVSNCKYPPVGHRSLTAPLPQLNFAALPVGEAIETLNRNTLVIVMLETPEAIANADEIAVVEGVDGLLIGSNDLAAEMGVPGDFVHPRMEKAYADMIAACRKHEKFPGMGGIYDHKIMEKYIRMGVRFMLGGSDVALMTASGRQRTEFLHGIALD